MAPASAAAAAQTAPDRSSSLRSAAEALEAFAARWDSRFPQISRMWRTHWANLTPFFDYPPEIRKVIYTTNAVESVNAQLRWVAKHRGAFPTPDSVRKVFYLAIMKASDRGAGIHTLITPGTEDGGRPMRHRR